MRKDILNAILELKEVKDLINKSEIARRFNCSINTVNKYLNIQNDNKSTRKYSSKLDDFKGIIIEKTDDYSANGRSIFNFIKDKGFTGSYGTVSRFIKEHKQEEQNKATMRFETTPGFQAQVDWKENFKIINKDGKEFEINIFLMILGYSRYKYIELTLDKTQDTLFECIIHACKSFRGVPHEVLFDNMATVVDRLSSTYRAVVINKKFAQFAKDVGFVVNTCRPYRPQTKGKIECVAKLMDRLKVYNKEFTTIEELDDIINKLMYEINNENINFIEKPIDRLKEEQKYLNSLPSIDCISQYFRQNKGYKVSKESMITYKKHKYSVPIKYIGEYLTVSENEDTLNIYYTTDLIASHKISRKIFELQKRTCSRNIKIRCFKK
jgi:transposase